MNQQQIQKLTLNAKSPTLSRGGIDRTMNRQLNKQTTDNSAIQKELQFQDTQVRKKVHELNTFIQSVKVALQDTNSEALDQLLQEIDNPRETSGGDKEDKTISQNYKVIDGKDNNQTTIYQGKTKLKTQEKTNEQHIKTSEDLGTLLSSMQVLLEKNLQESSELKFQLKNSNILNGLLNQQIDQKQKMENDDLIDTETNKIEKYQENISNSDTQLNQLQIQRLLTKNKELSQKILDLESKVAEVFLSEEILRKTMFSSFCVSSVEYIETNFDHLMQYLNQQSELRMQKSLIKIRNNNKILLTAHDVDEVLTFKTIDSNQIKDVFYPDKGQPIIAIVFYNEEKESDYSLEEQSFKIHAHSDQSPHLSQVSESRANIFIQKKLQVVVIKYENQDDFEKWDLALYAICQRNLAINQNYLFDNVMFDKPFKNEHSQPHQGNQEIERLKNLVEGVIQEKESELIIKRNQEIDQNQHNLRDKVVPKIMQSILPSRLDPNQMNQSMKQGDAQKLKLTPRQMILNDPKDELSKIYRAIGLLKSGFCVIKYSSKQLRPNQRVIYLSENELVLKWKEPLEKFKRSKSANKGNNENENEGRSIQLIKIKGIKDYADGRGFAKFRKSREGKNDFAITIQADRNLEIDASSLEEKILIIDCLKLALQNPIVKKILTKTLQA